MPQLTPPKDTSHRIGMSLLEVVAAVVISSMLAVAGFSLMRDRSTVAHSRICEGHRTALQSDVHLFKEENGRWPSTSLTDIETSDYAGPQLPRCPQATSAGKSNYRLRSGKVICQFHPDSTK